MKKNILIFVLGMIIMGGIVFAAEALISAENISYSSEYTDKTNVADALTDLLGVELSGTEYASYSLDNTWTTNSVTYRDGTIELNANYRFATIIVQHYATYNPSVLVVEPEDSNVEKTLLISDDKHLGAGQCHSTTIYKLDMKEASNRNVYIKQSGVYSNLHVLYIVYSN